MRVSLVNSNALNIPLADGSVHCVVTSPPYYGLRDYGTAKWEGGDADCEHKVGRFEYPVSGKQSSNSGSAGHQAGDICPKCGAKRIDAQLGLEPTLHEYIENTVKWCAEVHRVLREDGTFWLNLGDSYNSTSGFSRANEQWARKGRDGGANDKVETKEMGLKTKDLMLVPHRVAIALQEWGWWVRSDIVWHKPNPMPESVTDRPTKAHEYIFLLTKNKKYYYDAGAIAEKSVWADKDKRFETGPSYGGKTLEGNYSMQSAGAYRKDGKRNKRTVWDIYEDEFCQFLEWKQAQENHKKDIWTITTKPYSGAHFATFPPEIPETCIKAGTSEKGVCPVCGNQWDRVTEKETTFEGGSGKAGRTPEEIGGKWGDDRYVKNILLGPVNHVTTTGWQPTCSHDVEPVPATALDPFGGSGTTAMVANQLGRHGISLDLSWEYLQLAKKRTGITGLQEWESGKKAESNLEGLPMFEDAQ